MSSWQKLGCDADVSSDDDYRCWNADVNSAGDGRAMGRSSAAATYIERVTLAAAVTSSAAVKSAAVVEIHCGESWLRHFRG